MQYKYTERSPLLDPEERSPGSTLSDSDDEDGDLDIPPQDRGWRAWRFPLGASLIESVTWGE